MNRKTQRQTQVAVVLTEFQRRMVLHLVRVTKETVERLPYLNDNQLLYITDLEATIDALSAREPS